MKIYDKNNTLLLEVDVDDDSYAENRIHESHTLTLYYALPEYVELPEGAYVDFQGERYTLECAQKFTCRGDRHFEYTVVLDGPQARLRRYKVRDTTVQNLLKFAYTATPRQHLELIVKAMNRRESGWAIGSCIDAAEKTLQYNHTYCIDALQMLADEFATEWEIKGKSIYLRRVEYNRTTPLRLRYGRDCGLVPGVARENFGNKMPCDILLVQGGRKNIDASAYGHTELLLPKGQTIGFDGVRFSDEAGFDPALGRTYATDQTGTEIVRTDRPLTTYAEDSVDLSAIYPKRVGTVSAVYEVAGKDGSVQYDFGDAAIPDALDYSAQLIKGQRMSVIFQTGTLAGREFDVSYTHAERRFQLVQRDYDGIRMPGGTVYVPRTGDRYAVFGCSLPDAYLCDNATRTGASWEMFREAVRVKFEHETERYTFSGQLDELFAERRWIEIGGKIVKGGYVLLESDKFADAAGLLIRITGVRTPVNRPRRPQIELSNVASSGSLAGQLKKIDRQEVVTDELADRVRRETNRTYDHAKEAQEMLERAIDGFTAGVNPIWIRTMSILLGQEHQQLMFVDNRTDAQREVIPLFEMDNAAKVFTAPAAILKHMTLGIDKTSSAHKAADYRYWEVAGYTSPYLGGEASAYYLVAKCAKTGGNGEFLLQKEYKYDPGDGFYYFLVGLLSSETGGERSFATAYGYTEILPGQMRIKMIISPDGRTYFNVSEGVIGGNIRILPGSSGYNNLSDKPDLGVFTTKSEFNVYTNQISGQVSAIRTQTNATKEDLARLDTWAKQQNTAVLNRLSAADNNIYNLQTAGFITTAQGNALYASAELANGYKLASLITQTPSAISLIGQNINLSGNVTFTSFQSSVNNQLTQKQGKNDPFDMNNARLNGQTVIEGGYIKASLINTRNLIVTDGARIGDFLISHGGLISKSGSSMGDYRTGLTLEADGVVRAASGNGNVNITMNQYYPQVYSQGGEMPLGMLSIKILNSLYSGMTIPFLTLDYSSGASRRFASIEARVCHGDVGWYHRLLFRISHMPFRGGLTNVEDIPNKMGDKTYAVRYDARTGCFYIE